MLRQQAERWWAVALRGLVAVVFGVVTLAWPNLTLAAIILLYALFSKVVPIISMWELKAGDHPPPDLIPPATEEHPLGELRL